MESSALKDIGQVSDIEEAITGSVRLRALKARLPIVQSMNSHMLSCPIFYIDILFDATSFSYQKELVIHQMLNLVQMLMILDLL